MQTTKNKKVSEERDQARPEHRPKAYDEVNVEAQKMIHTQPKMAHAVKEVHDREADQEKQETPPVPPDAEK